MTDYLHIQLPPDAQQLLTGFHRPAAGGEDEVPLPDARQVCGGAGRDLQHLQAPCLLYPSDAADERPSVDLDGPRIIT